MRKEQGRCRVGSRTNTSEEEHLGDEVRVWMEMFLTDKEEREMEIHWKKNAGDGAVRREKKRTTREEISRCAERWHAVGWCDRGEDENG